MRFNVILGLVSCAFSLMSSPLTGDSHDNYDVETYSITITITGIRNNKGSIFLKFYDDEKRFPETEGFRIVKVSKTNLKEQSLTVTCYGFSAKHMGVSLLDDENDNKKLDFGLVLPKEGHAFSDYHHTAIRKPVYEDFRFFLSGNKNVKMKMKYY